ncbi:hypothetical protein KC960_04430 [Candidatus Saccharibacteria bacterium]|nr:hypothetical protein [Candidatus Saccharibacteria bacterium]
MGSEYDKLKNSGELDQTYGTLKATTELIEVTKNSNSITKEQYESLANKFEQSMQVIEILRSKIQELESKKMPSKEEVESMSSMLDLLGKLDETSIARIKKLGELNNE